MAGNDRIRTEGTRNLVAAARAAGARRIVAQSIAFAYAPTGDGLKREQDPLWDDAPWPWKRSIDALHELEDAVTEDRRASRAWCSVTDSSTGRGRHTGRAVSSNTRCGAVASRSSGAAPACSRSSTSTTPPTPPWRRSNAGRPGSTTSSTTSPRRCASGSRRTRMRSAPSGRCRVPRFLARMLAGPYAVMLATEVAGRLQRAREGGARLAAPVRELAGGVQGVAALAAAVSRRSSSMPSVRERTGS